MTDKLPIYRSGEFPYECPECGGNLLPGYDEKPDGQRVGDGTAYCASCSYTYNPEVYKYD